MSSGAKSTDRYAELDKLLGSPVIFVFDDETLKTKNRLLVVSIIGILISIFGVSLSPESTLFGLKFNNLDNNLILKILVLLNYFFLFRFIWSCYEYYHEWRLRVTGSGLASKAQPGELASVDVDYTDDLRNSTLYNWWRFESKRFSQSENVIISKALEGVKERLSSTRGLEDEGAIHRELRKISDHLGNISSLLNNPRLGYSLSRFDNYFTLFCNMQNYRWLVLDLLLPIVLGLLSIVLIFFYKKLDIALIIYLI